MAQPKGRKPKKTEFNEPAPRPSERPDAPGDLEGIALDAWESLCDDLSGQGTLAKADRKLMEVYCRLYATYRRVSDKLASEEIVTISEKTGRGFVNPLINLQSDLANKLRQCLGDLALTAKGRKVPKPPEPEDKMTSFLAKR